MTKAFSKLLGTFSHKTVHGGNFNQAETLKEKIAKGIALFAIGLTREEIQKLPNLCCSETIHKNLMQFIETDQWFQLEQFILRSFRTVKKQEMNDLETKMLESRYDPNLLRNLSVERRTLSGQKQEELFRRREIILRAHWPPRERGKNRPKPKERAGLQKRVTNDIS